jgi:SCP-2 sterol transfer family
VPCATPEKRDYNLAVDIQKLFNEDLPAQFAKNPDQVKAIGGKFQLNITGDGGGEWFIDASDTGPSVMPGQGPAADITITIGAEDFEKLQENPQTNGMALFNGGKMIIQGNAMLGMKLVNLFTLGPS